VRSADLGGDPDREVEIRIRAGMSAPLVDLRVVDPDMKDVPSDGKTAGEIVLRATWHRISREIRHPGENPFRRKTRKD
jgi:fatty-acyl-CoA synthase